MFCCRIPALLVPRVPTKIRLEFRFCMKKFKPHFVDGVFFFPGYASAIDLGDPTSPFGNVHFQNKQAIARRIVSAAMHVAFGVDGGSGGTLEYVADFGCTAPAPC